ncbi:MAG: YIP1 family protein [Anaerolineaceae bacterium]|nr:YIP1 family protein [Anaerolineaceae bacterium]
MLNRMIRAVRLDRTLFRMVADDPEYTNEAVMIAVIVSIVAALGALSGPNPAMNFVLQLLSNLLFGWVLWALVAYFVGTSFFKGRSSPMEMMRTLAYAGIPRLLGVLAIIPCVGWIGALIGGILAIIAGVIAIRESMEFDTTSAVITAIVGFILYIIASAVLGLIFAAPVALLNQ